MYSIRHYRLFSPGTQVSSTNKTDMHDIADILLKVALNTIPLTLTLTKLIFEMLNGHIKDWLIMMEFTDQLLPILLFKACLIWYDLWIPTKTSTRFYPPSKLSKQHGLVITFTFTDVDVYFRKQLPNMLAKWKMGKSSIHKLCRPNLNRVINKGICHVSASKCNGIYLLFIEFE